MRFAYADPPYLCGAHLYKKEHPEWAKYASIEGHARLIRQLIDEYPDGWALSMSSSDIVSMCSHTPLCGKHIRWAAWVKPFASFKPGVNPGYCWEPVAFFGGRKRTDGAEDTVRDFLAESITLKKGLAGAKPPKFCAWILDLLGWRPEDDIDDLFPGTGVMGRVVEQRRAQANNEPLRLIP